ncbi:MAG TPA: phosphoglycerate mutase family protein [Bacteroidales bacterium]|nr:phosphoglycerate mutase family protein [Bacteroidales bacterium]
MKILKLSVFALLIAAGLLIMSCQTTTIYLVRHAEKKNETDTSSLTGKGVTRSYALRDTMLKKNIRHIYVSTARRTQLTARPTADTLHLTPIIYPGTQSLIDSLQTYRISTNIFVVAHSNTIPVIIDSLMKAPQHLPYADFDDFYTVKISWGNEVTRTLKKTTYGPPSP